jgi:tetratricopeptide (TPR) repeat protein
MKNVIKLGIFLLIIATSCSHKSVDFSNTDEMNILKITRQDLEKHSSIELVNFSTEIMLKYSAISTKDIKVLKKCVEILDVAIEKNPRNDFAYQNKISLLLSLKEFDKALFTIDKMLLNIGDFAEGYFGKGMVLEYIGEIDNANLAYDKAILLYDIKLREDPENISVIGSRIMVYCFREGVTYALFEIEKAIEKYPDEQYLINVRDTYVKEFDRKNMIEGTCNAI